MLKLIRLPKSKYWHLHSYWVILLTECLGRYAYIFL